MANLTYSNPRLDFVVNDWPYGRQQRVKAHFYIEQKGDRERAIRVTENPKGRPNAPKKLTFSKMARIVDGSDGRTYIARLSEYGHISIMQSNMKLEQESIHQGDPRWADIFKLFD